MIRRVKELSPGQKAAIESLIGQTLSDQDNISVHRLAPPAPLSAEHRKEIVDCLRKHFALIDSRRQPMTDEEAEQTIDEAIRSVKPGYRPIV